MLENAILITGVSQRVGLHLATQFARQTSYPVIGTYRTYRPGLETLNELGVHLYPLDLCDPSALAEWLAQLSAQVRSLRVLIHNASIWVTDEEISKHPDLFWQMLQLHQSVPWQLNQALAPMLLNSTESKADIISLSDHSVAMGLNHYSAYASTKAGLQNLTKSFAKKLAPKVQVNDIAPGLLMFNEGDAPEYQQARLAKQLLPIEPGPEVIWQTVQYLMDSPYVTGISLPVDGGVVLAGTK